MATGKMDSSAVYALFEEINRDEKRSPKVRDKTQSTYRNYPI